MVGPHSPRRGVDRTGTATIVHTAQEEGRMSINRTRGTLYRLARILGDIQAVRTGRVGRRVGRRIVGRATGRGIGRLFR